MHRHPLEKQAGRLNEIASRVGRRLMVWIKQIEGQEQNLVRIVGRDIDSGRLITEDVLNRDGEVIKVPVLPDADFRENWKLYQKTVSELLTEQRHRAAMGAGKGGQPLDDAKFEESLRELARQTVLEMSDADLAKLLAARKPAKPVGEVEAAILARNEAPNGALSMLEKTPSPAPDDFLADLTKDDK